MASHSKHKHKKFLRAQKNKRRRERKKAETRSRKEFMFEEYLLGCDEAIDLHMKPASGLYYRAVHKDLIPIDIMPQDLVDYDSLTPKITDLPLALSPGANLEEQEQQVRAFSPSFNISKEGVAEKLGPFYLRKKNDKQREKFLRRVGEIIVPVDLIEEDGLVWEESDGHVYFQPYKDFDLASHIAKDESGMLLVDYIVKHQS